MHDQTGFVFSPDHPNQGLEHLLQLVNDPALRRSMGAKARLRFEEQFGVAAMMQAYEAFWRELG